MHRLILISLLSASISTAAAPAVAARSEGTPAVIERAPGSGRPYAMRIAHPHPFSVDEARARLHYLLDYWTQRFGVRQQWHGNSVLVTGSVVGINVEARVEIQEDRVSALAVDPGPIMRGTAERYIRRKLAKYLHPTYDEP